VATWPKIYGRPATFPFFPITHSFKVKTECIPFCVLGSIFTHKMTDSEINTITSVYYNAS
jgi:hypothetical protein